MVINRRDIKRKRKDNTSNCSILDDSPKRTKVHAQRKFAQGSNVSSPVITPVKEIEKQEKIKPDVMPEPQELLPMNRPHTEDFLTFLCFRGTPMLPANLNFFNTAPLDCRVNSQPKAEPVEACPPLASISAKTTPTGERPFIAFGVRKRADPVLVSKHMDKKRRHALALQALRRKYQEQKMAKLRAVTISKLSEKITTTEKSLVRTRSATKSETTTSMTKKNITEKTRVKIVSTKRVKITRAPIKTPLRATLKTPIKTQLQKRMCLRSFRGRFIHRELQLKKPKKTPPKIIKKETSKKKKETSSEFSSDDDEPLMKTVKVIKPSSKVPLPKVAKKCAAGPKKPVEINFRLTRASYPLYREQTVKRKIQIRSSLPTKSPFVKLTPPKMPLADDKTKAARLKRDHDEEASSSQKPTEDKPKKDAPKKKIEAEKEFKKKIETEKELKKKVEQEKETKKKIEVEKETKKKIELEKEAKKKSELEKEAKKKLELEKEAKKKLELEKEGKKKTELEKEAKKKLELEKEAKKKLELEKEAKKKLELEKEAKKKFELEKEDSKVIELDKETKKKIELEKEAKKKLELEKEAKKKLELEREAKNKLELEKEAKKKLELEKEAKKKLELEKEAKKKLELEKETKKKPEISISSSGFSKEVKKKTEAEKELKKKVDAEKEVKKKPDLEKKLDEAPKESKRKLSDSDSPPPARDLKKKPETIKSSEGSSKKKNVKPEEDSDKPKKLPGKKELSPEKEPPKPKPEDEPKVPQRPTRKTKEAAAIYMEILGHKLVSEGEGDDDISIDSFPELPNVRKTEQRENELKAKARSKTDHPKTTKPKKADTSDNQSDHDLKKSQKSPENARNTRSQQAKKSTTLKPEIFSDSDSSLRRTKTESSKRVLRNSKTDDVPNTRRVSSSKSVNYVNFSESDESVKEKSYKNKPKEKKKAKPAAMKTRSKKVRSESDSDESTTSTVSKKLAVAGKKAQKASTEQKPDNSFSDSDEEPLSKLTQNKTKDDKEEPPKPKVEETKKAEEPELNLATKPKRECTKRPQNYLTLFSSSEDEDKYFHGFSKQTKVTKAAEKKCQTPTQSADLLCKDVDKRFGKGKVNMSTEQIEKWLKESAMAGENHIKKEPEETQEVAPSKPEAPKPVPKLEEARILPPKPPSNPEPPSSSSSPEKQEPASCFSAKPTERKTIFRKERRVTAPNVNAFSPENESSVYAFEADTEDIISTPFRRPVRRPSSTATSRSEDSSVKYEEGSRNKFRLPHAVRDTKPNKQEVSLMLSTDESSNNASIAVQLNLDSTEVFPSTEVQSPTDGEDGEQLFYIPLQPGKQTSAQIIQGVAVKLGTKGVNGPNQRVVMSAKLVTHTPAGAQKLMEKPLATSTPMYPPPTAVQKKLEPKAKPVTKSSSSENLEEFKYKIPSSPSASSSSSTKINTASKRPTFKSRLRPLEVCSPVKVNEFPSAGGAALVEAPVFHPNEKEFQDPLEYIEKIRPVAEKFGICRIIPPANFKPECKVSDDMRFTAYNQYVHKMLHRWGPNFKELIAITRYLKTQNIALTHPPWIGGMEIDLPRLYQIVQSLGGLKEVIEKKKWPKVSEMMKIPKSAQDRVTKLDDIYCKYLLPYDTLSQTERDKLFDEVETDWAKRESRALLRSQQNITNRDPSPNNSESDSDDESEECIVKGRNMALNAFYRIARNTMTMWFKTMEPSAQDVEQEFWKHVTVKANHICVHSGSIDSGNWGYGFAVSKNSPFARHAWNLKVLTNNSGSVLRSMGPVMGVTVPTLHVGMVFSACCWYRDPHSLPWIEYLHTGGNKIWYGIPDSMSSVFHKTLIKLVPNYCRNKSLWLPSDTAMVPPSLLVENGVSLCRTIQEPGQFIIVFPKVFTSSICTGYVVSESVYFAPLTWLNSAQNIFNELQNSCEPSMFSLERLLISIGSDARSSIDVLRRAISDIENLCEQKQRNWKKIEELGLTSKEKLPLPDAAVKKKKKLQNDSGDYECEVCCRNLFVSWITESQEDGIYCLSHAIEYIEKKKIEIQNCKLVYTYDDHDLVNLIDKMKSTIETKMQKKTAGKNV